MAGRVLWHISTEENQMTLALSIIILLLLGALGIAIVTIRLQHSILRGDQEIIARLTNEVHKWKLSSHS